MTDPLDNSESKPQQTRHQEDHAQVKFPPPLIFVLLMLLAAGLDALWPLGMGVADGFQVVGIVITLSGIAIAILVGISFKRSSTAIEPWKPTTRLISHGFYRWSRNPIYVGFCLFNMGIGVALNSMWIFLSFLPAALLVYYIAIAREEAYLERRFGNQYLEYKRTVRRWI